MSFEPEAFDNQPPQVNPPSDNTSKKLPSSNFIGREAAQERFREMLLDMVGNRKGFLGSLLGSGSRSPKTSQPVKSRVTLVGGLAGIGKTRLTLRLRDIALKEKEFARRFRVTRLEWAEVFERDSRLAAILSGETLPLEVLLDILQNHCIRDNAGGYFEPYKTALEETKKLVQTVTGAELLAVWEYRARAIGRCLKDWSSERPLLFFMDNFELVAEAATTIFQPMLEECGSQVGFILSGERLPENMAELTAPERFAAYNLKGFDQPELRRFFELEQAGYADNSLPPNRPAYTSPETLRHLEAVTAGQPLVARLAAFLLETGLPLSELPLPLPGQSPEARLLDLFANDALMAGHPDRLKLYALASLRRPEQGLLAALFDLRPDLLPVNEVLERLDQRYAFLFEPGRLMIVHPAVNTALRRWLLDPLHRYDEQGLAKINRRGLEYLNIRLEEWSVNFPTLRDRVSDLKWREWALDKVWHTMWLSEDQGWPEALALLTAGLGYRPALARQVVALLEKLAQIGVLNEVGLRRLELFRQVALDPTAAPDALRELRIMGLEGGFFRASMPKFTAELERIINQL